MTDDSSSVLSSDNPRKLSSASVEHQITVELGYCCELFFWRRFEHLSNHLIAVRLGMEVATIRRHRRRYNEGLFKCKRKGTKCVLYQMGGAK